MTETLEKPARKTARKRSAKAPSKSAAKTSKAARSAKGGGAKAASGQAPAAMNVTPEVRRQMIAEAAYFRAEARGFVPGHEEEDWLAAEAEVDALLAGGSQH